MLSYAGGVIGDPRTSARPRAFFNHLWQVSPSACHERARHVANERPSHPPSGQYAAANVGHRCDRQGAPVAPPHAISGEEFCTRARDDDLPVYPEGELAPLHPAHALRLIQLGYTNPCIGESARAQFEPRRHTAHAAHRRPRACPYRTAREVGEEVESPAHISCVIRSGEDICAEVFHRQTKLRGVESTAAGEKTR